MLAGPLLDRLQQSLEKIAHLKIFDRAASGYVKAALCGGDDDPVAEGDLLADAEYEHELVINLRAPCDPDELHRVVMLSLDEIEGRVEIRYSNAFRPAYPRPEHRFKAVVQRPGPSR